MVNLHQLIEGPKERKKERKKIKEKIHFTLMNYLLICTLTSNV